MKNEDTKKLLNEERQDLRKLKKVISFSLFFLTLTGIPLYAQIYLNGFVRYEDYPTIPDAQKIYASFIDDDAKSDFIILSGGKTAGLHLSTNNYKLHSLNLPYAVSNIIKLFSEDSGTVCFFLSRKEKLAGLVKIFTGGSFKILNKIDFDSYPTNISYYKRKNKNYILVYGENFNGLELLAIENNTIKSTRLIKNHLIRGAEFIDIDYDGVIDICCLDLIENEIKFLLNNQLGGFEQQRSISYGKHMESYSIIDYNFDGFFDLVYNFGNSLEVSYGDSVSTFAENKNLIKSDDPIIKYKLADFNRDGYFDAAVITGSDSSKTVKVAFSRDGSNLSTPFDYFSGDVKDIDGADYNPAKLVFLAGNTLNVISPLSRINLLKLAVNPSDIFCFNDDNDFFVYDSTGQCINFMRDNYRETSLINVSKYFNEMRYYQNDDEQLLYLYEKGKRSLEVISADVEEKRYRNTLIYSPITVDDVMITPSSSREYPKITIVSNNKNRLEMIEYYYKDIRYLSSTPKIIAENVLSFSTAGNNIFYIGQENDGKYSLNQYNIKSSLTSTINTGKILKEGNYFSVLSFINKKDENILILEKENNLTVLYKDQISNIDISYAGRSYKLFIKADKLNISYLYLSDQNGTLHKIGPLESLKGNYKTEIVSKNVAKKFLLNYNKKNDEIIYNVDKPSGVVRLIWEN